MRRVVIHIEEVRLTGFSETAGAELRETLGKTLSDELGRELTRALAEPGTLSGCRNLALAGLTLGRVDTRPESASSDLGIHIARGICGRLTG